MLKEKLEKRKLVKKNSSITTKKKKVVKKMNKIENYGME